MRRLSPGFLAIMPHPAAGPQLTVELQALRRSGVELLVSLLDAHESADLGLADAASVCAQCGIEHRSHPVADMSTPADGPAFTALARSLKHRLLAGAGIAIHCRAGIGRSGLLAASVLVACGAKPEEAFAEISRARGASVPEVPAQGRWLEQHQQALVAE
ncbi:MAG: protein tyrosine phosphatase [Gammaproteobacteria bacterium]|nr:protein tyrosine phosphatase [Gammaproteobacteria bacterium]